MYRYNEERKGEVKPQIVIATSGNSSTGDIFKYQKAGFNGMLRKPMRIKSVVKSVSDYVKFLELTVEAGYAWAAGQKLPPGCPKPEIRSASTFEDGYYFGDLEVFGTNPRK